MAEKIFLERTADAPEVVQVGTFFADLTVKPLFTTDPAFADYLIGKGFVKLSDAKNPPEVVEESATVATGSTTKITEGEVK